MRQTGYKKDSYQAFVNARHIDLEKINRIITQDVCDVLRAYLDIENSDVVLKLEPEGNGYVLRCKARAKRLKIVGFL